MKRRLRRAASIADLRAIARRAIPGAVFDYIDGGAEDERTMRANADDFGTIRFAPRVLRDVGEVDPSVPLLGRPAAIPLILSPTGLTRIAHGAGELAVARAAEEAGIPYTLSTVSSRSIEEVASASDGDRWFQLYVGTDHGRSEALLHRASAAAYRVLMVTVDSAAIGKRERDLRRGLTLPPSIGLGTLVDGAFHPRWTIDFMRAGPIQFANFVSTVGGPGTYSPKLDDDDLSAFDLDARLTWRDLDWIRAAWPGPIVLKGIQSVADAKIAADSGVDAIALSNHGGRQLDGAVSSIELVAPVADAVGGRLEIYCDGGIRRGGDVVKALALGATACMVGRRTSTVSPPAANAASLTRSGSSTTRSAAACAFSARRRSLSSTATSWCSAAAVDRRVRKFVNFRPLVVEVALELASTTMAIALSTADAVGGRRAFMDGRPPVFEASTMGFEDDGGPS